jgi:hypothetical protein
MARLSLLRFAEHRLPPAREPRERDRHDQRPAVEELLNEALGAEKLEPG